MSDPHTPSRPEPFESEIEDSLAPHPHLRVITGGGGTSKNPNWLKALKVDTVFLCKNMKHPSIALNMFHILHQQGKATHLLNNQGDHEENFWVDSAEFSATTRLIEVLQEGE